MSAQQNELAPSCGTPCFVSIVRIPRSNTTLVLILVLVKCLALGLTLALVFLVTS